MPYGSFKVEFETLGILNDLNSPVEVLKTLLGTVPQENLLGFNFNRYWGREAGQYHPAMDVRLNVDNIDQLVQAIRRTLEELVKQGKIRWYSSDPEEWHEPEFVVHAHEVATRCAIEFVDRMSCDNTLLGYLKRQPVEVMGHFVRLFLLAMGFEPYVAWTYLRSQPPDGLDKLARKCAELVDLSTYDRDRRSDYLERLLHAFFNCTIPSVEPHIVNYLMASNYWHTLAERRLSR